MNGKRFVFFAQSIAIALLAACCGGCESAESNGLEISTTRRDFAHKGETATLTATGWNEYKWSLSAPSIGRLSSSTGSSVVYTAIDIPDAGASYQNQTVTCQALDTTGESGTGTIVLRHVSEGGSATAEEPVEPIRKLEISPTSATVSSPGQTVDIRVTASTQGPYTWTVIKMSTNISGNIDLGTVSPSSGAATVYTAPSPLPTSVDSAVVQCSDGTSSARCEIHFQH